MKISDDFFYHARSRNQPGVGWWHDENQSVAACPHGIRIPVGAYGASIEASILHVKNDGQIEDKGEFAISAEKVSEWEKKHGVWMSNCGNRYIVVPISLWEQIRRPIKKEKQLKLI